MMKNMWTVDTGDGDTGLNLQ